MRTLMFCGALLAPAHAVACENLGGLLKSAYPTAVEEDEGLRIDGEYARLVRTDEVACKVWPADEKLTLLAVPLIEAEPEDEGEARGDVEIIVADTTTGQPQVRRVELNMAFGDAIQFSGVRLDTARYDIKSGTRAFGVVTRQTGSSRVNPWSQEALWLYTINKDRIDRVVDGLVIDAFSGENDGNCSGEASHTRRTVALAPPAHSINRDLLVEEVTVTSTMTGTAGACNSADVTGEPKQVTLRLMEGRYQPTISAETDGLFSGIEIAAP